MDPFLGQIIMFGGGFAPRGWAFCNGQLLSIAQNSALFSILGTTYGGDGRSTFALPDLRGRTPVHAGTGPGLTTRRIGQRSGAETVTLNLTQVPAHDHTAQQPGSSAGPTTGSPANAQAATVDQDAYNQGGPTNSSMQAFTTGSTGGGGGHDNMQPFQVVNYIIAMEGIYPSRN